MLVESPASLMKLLKIGPTPAAVSMHAQAFMRLQQLFEFNSSLHPCSQPSQADWMAVVYV